jgi:hypothetical protein
MPKKRRKSRVTTTANSPSRPKDRATSLSELAEGLYYADLGSNWVTGMSVFSQASNIIDPASTPTTTFASGQVIIPIRTVPGKYTGLIGLARAGSLGTLAKRNIEKGAVTGIPRVFGGLIGWWTWRKIVKPRVGRPINKLLKQMQLRKLVKV